MPGLPPTWAIVFGIIGLFLAGGSGIIWALRRELRESRQAPALEEKQRLENERTAAAIAAELRGAQKDAVADMRLLLAEARAEVGDLRGEVAELRAEVGTLKGQLNNTREELSGARGVIASLVRFVDQLVRWGRNGGQGTQPRPSEELHAYLDGIDWDPDPGSLIQPPASPA